MTSLSERLDFFAEAWRPEPGDKLVGTVIDLDERESAFSEEPYPIVTVKTDDRGEFAWHAYHTVARRELAKQRPRTGDRIGIAYHGKPDGKAYERYRVIVERDEKPKALDWDRIATEAGSSDDDAGQLAADDELPF